MKEIQPEECIFYIVDVFTEIKFEGNQLAVFVCNEKLTTEMMQKIAKEMNFSETVFITSIDDYEIRIFTPEMELPFAGHPTLGAAYVFQQKLIKGKLTTLLLNMKIGQIAVLFKYKGDTIKEMWMEQKQPTFYGFFLPDLIAEVLNLNEEDIDGRFQIQEVSTGIPFIIVPLKSLDAIRRAKLNREKYYELITNTQAKSILMFCPETYDRNNNLNVRVFCEAIGVPEDPATGSGNGCLAAYLVKHEYFGKKSIDIKVEQGYEIGRKSLLLLRAEEKGGKFYIGVGGNAKIIAKGELI
ncbi:MAG: PhzF family phenazine biosynthesis protein [Candidatus Thorarchaeota archaeon]